ncbi:MAG TPA: hypothetical protein PLZ77_01110 [Lachnospiraceae bacterium]|nr:hypothetical protein [Lachnospiraceae bacterium]
MHFLCTSGLFYSLKYNTKQSGVETLKMQWVGCNKKMNHGDTKDKMKEKNKWEL